MQLPVPHQLLQFLCPEGGHGSGNVEEELALKEKKTRLHHMTTMIFSLTRGNSGAGSPTMLFLSQLICGVTPSHDLDLLSWSW